MNHRFGIIGLAAAALGILAACGPSSAGDGAGTEPRVDTPSSGGSGNTSPPTNPPVPCAGDDAVTCSLEALGVDTRQTQRVDERSEPLPDDYAPMGPRTSLTKIDELLVAGARVVSAEPSQTEAVSLFDWIPEQLNPDGSLESPARLDLVQTGAPTNWESASHRNAVGADVDRDGRDELVVVFRSDADQRLYVRVQEDESAGFAQYELPLGEAALPDLERIELIEGDLDADGAHEIVTALIHPDHVTLHVLDARTDGKLAPRDGFTQAIAAAKTDSTISVSLATGNLDNDGRDELSVVVNELFDEAGEQGIARYFVYDASGGRLKPVASGNALVVTETEAYVLKLAGTTIGDVTGDGRADLVIGGLSIINSHCENWPDYVVGVYRLGEEAIEPVTSFSHHPSFGGCEDVGPARIRAAFVSALDIDGDAIDEISFNHVVFDDQTAEWELLGNFSSAFFEGQGGAFRVERENTALSVGDVTSDGSEDIVFVNEYSEEVRILGMTRSPTGELSFGRHAGVPVEPHSVERPLLVPTDVDHDSFAMAYSATEHQLIFTEPVLVAVLAAAPCYDDAGQNTEACTSSFGNTETSGNSQDGYITVEASYIWGAKTGVEAPIVKVSAEVEVTKKVTLALSVTASHAYSLERSVTYTTGPLEDNVIFTTVPYDQYSYVILSHPEPSEVGKEIVFLVPREPLTLQVERSFYNQHHVGGGIAVDSTILKHTPGVPSSYPSAQDKDGLLGRHGGLETVSHSVGQGAGNVALALDVATEWGIGGSLELGFEYEAKATAGVVIGGYSVGARAGVNLSWTTGQAASYRGVVGNMTEEFFPDHMYGFGLFAYKMEHSYGQEFQVINYWVE